MALQFLDDSEDRDFKSGETIYDVDGNAYTVANNCAKLKSGNLTVSYFLGREMKKCFSRRNPKVAA